MVKGRDGDRAGYVGESRVVAKGYGWQRDMSRVMELTKVRTMDGFLAFTFVAICIHMNS